MPDKAPPPAAPPAPTVPSSIPPGMTAGAPGTPPANGSPAPQWRAPVGAPAWAQGKSAEEILGIANTLVDMYSKGGEPTREAPPAPVTAPQIADDDYVSGAQLKQFLAAASAPNTDSINLAASASYGVVRSQHAATFAKYGPEIEAKLARVPRNLWTLDNLETVVKMVRSDHHAEIVEEGVNERIRQLTESGTALRSSGAATPLVPVTRDQSLESEKIPAEWKRRASEAGVTERTVEEFCRSNDMTPADFYKQFDTPLNRIVEDHGAKRA